MMRKRVKWLVIAGTGVLLTLALFVGLSKRPPTTDLNEARKKIAVAEQLNAALYAGDIYRIAHACYDSAMNAWQVENDKFILFRDYTIVLKQADLAKYWASEASKQVHTKISDHKIQLQLKIKSIQGKLEHYDKRYKTLPLPASDLGVLATCRIYLTEGIKLFHKGDFINSQIKLKNSEAIISQINGKSEQILTGYFKQWPQWHEWINKTLDQSRKSGSVCLIVDKYGRQCAVYKKGQLLHTFPIEISANWIGDKNLRGDNCTPEGYYKVTRKKAGGETRYYKALLLNYPNDEDKNRFRRNQNNGSIGKSSEIGSLIEIHGDGGKGMDWTDGCIALKNDEMDILYPYCNVGTAVTIVGSVEPLPEKP